ncbi:hypothetical protein ABT255_57595 [Streptomyces mirabilis]|uniref:hypothetical protein n=1 Tax=Streptomyces mirabilis TaxID=68239 RepID=UPI003318FFB5
MSTRGRTVIIACVVVAGISCVAHASHRHDDGAVTRRPSVTATATASHPSHAAAKPKPTPTAQPSDLPRLDHQGDGLANCVIRYRANGGSTGWTVFSSRPGTVELEATALNGHTYDKSWYAETSHNRTVYVTSMDIPVPLTQLGEITGTLVDANTGDEYRCLVGPGA